MVHLVLALLVAEGPMIGPRPLAGRLTYRVNLRPDRRDYQLISPPGPGVYTVLLEGDNPGGKSKLLFAKPLPAGAYGLTVRATAAGDQTFAFSVPLEGAATFVVRAGGKARYDFSFQLPSGKEYRFTFTAPVSRRTFHVAP
jgi:hypothetical protein